MQGKSFENVLQRQRFPFSSFPLSFFKNFQTHGNFKNSMIFIEGEVEWLLEKNNKLWRFDSRKKIAEINSLAREEKR